MVRALDAISHEASVGHPFTRNTAECTFGPATIAALKIRGLIEVYSPNFVYYVRPVAVAVCQVAL
jgi:hypothetical protein